jgi:YHS domain-containing protein
MKKLLKIIGFALALIVTALVAVAMIKDIRPISWGLHKPVYQPNGIALAGYDVVSYFQGKPGMGSKQYSFVWKESTWLFSSAENLETFKSTPEKYEPQFGGYCTVAVSTGFTAPGDPSIYAIRDGKLFIFSSDDVKSEFISNPQELIAACSRHWNK